ncbi:MAG: tRNA (adenosine(37)-N6)-dimethylallyltransferase MiaA, partial [Actinobacteria bacterium]|nr:tRNA (adenosine(37)-N6)-dimethylallyltransferase MiaA [Actinomycetota bacterium]
GYKEVLRFLNGETVKRECIDEVKKNSRRLVKKQLTWFRADKRIKWIRTDNYDNIFDLTEKVLQEVNKYLP